MQHWRRHAPRKCVSSEPPDLNSTSKQQEHSTHKHHFKCDSNSLLSSSNNSGCLRQRLESELQRMAAQIERYKSQPEEASTVSMEREPSSAIGIVALVDDESSETKPALRMQAHCNEILPGKLVEPKELKDVTLDAFAEPQKAITFIRSASDSRQASTILGPTALAAASSGKLGGLSESSKSKIQTWPNQSLDVSLKQPARRSVLKASQNNAATAAAAATTTTTTNNKFTRAVRFEDEQAELATNFDKAKERGKQDKQADITDYFYQKMADQQRESTPLSPKSDSFSSLAGGLGTNKATTTERITTTTTTTRRTIKSSDDFVPTATDIQQVRSESRTGSISSTSAPLYKDSASLARDSQQQQQSSSSTTSSTTTTSNKQHYSGSSSKAWPGSSGDGLQTPLVQDTEEGRILKLRFDVTQYEPDEIVVKTVDNRLTVHAKHEERSENRSVYREYNREFHLPDGTDVELIKSSLSKDGILTVDCPLPSPQIHGASRRIPIEKV